VTDGLDVVAVRVADVGAVVARVVLGPLLRLVEHLGTLRGRGVPERAYGVRVAASNATCTSRFGSPVVNGPIQNVGRSPTPYPMTLPKSSTRTPLMAPSTVS
jgi:hypothetical protein